MTSQVLQEASAKARRRVVLMDYGVGNLGSLKGTLHRLGYQTSVGRQAADFNEADAVLLPGVGAMPAAMSALHRTKLDSVVADLLTAQTIPMIGICLGMQLMFQHSEEGDSPGLGLLKGQVRRFRDHGCHVGWSVCPTPVGSTQDGGWTDAAFYFNHSYFIDADPAITRSVAQVEGQGPIATIVQSGNFTGLQFHPEKSQTAGTDLLHYLLDKSGGPTAC